MDDFKNIHEEYSGIPLLEENLPEDPLVQFETWFAEHLAVFSETSNAMVLSTIDPEGRPDSRVVLLKGLDKGAFVFYTNYYSAKGVQLDSHPLAALNFYWPDSKRQVRVRGTVKRTTKQDSNDYFSSRPKVSQLSSIASHQSQEVENRLELERALNELVRDYADKAVDRPPYWGGFMVFPDEIEFWQGRENRLHDRIQYSRNKDTWHRRRLAP